MQFIEEAGMLEAVSTAGFQYKNGAAFARDGRSGSFDFREKFSAGPGTTFQVQRGPFDKVLADCAADSGADIRYGHRIEAVSFDETGNSNLNITTDQGREYSLKASFLLDASGFGRVLPRLLQLDRPSSFPVRRSVFTHIEDNISAPGHDRNKILIVIHPQRADVWYWLIPFSNGRCSVGTVAPQDYFLAENSDPAMELKRALSESPDLCRLLDNAVFDDEIRNIVGYSCDVSSLWGEGFALIGNAGEFLDPVFSSGVTIAMKSSSLAAAAVDRQLRGESVDWETDYAQPLKLGVETFRTYVDAWYDGSFQEVIFAKNQAENIREMISSILAGYAWDEANPFVAHARRRLAVLVDVCRAG
jgi:flavin-dependent dehydrogenase